MGNPRMKKSLNNPLSKTIRKLKMKKNLSLQNRQVFPWYNNNRNMPYVISLSGNIEEMCAGAGPVDISDYNPSKSNYHPIKDAAWKRGDPVPYMALARTLELVSEMILYFLSNHF